MPPQWLQSRQSRTDSQRPVSYTHLHADELALLLHIGDDVVDGDLGRSTGGGGHGNGCLLYTSIPSHGVNAALSGTLKAGVNSLSAPVSVISDSDIDSVSYTHLDVYKRQGPDIVSLVVLFVDGDVQLILGDSHPLIACLLYTSRCV